MLAAAVLLLLAVACSQGTNPSASLTTAPTLEPSEPFGVTSVTLRAPDGNEAIEVPVYDAFEPAARQRGLMERAELAAGAGMVFRFPSEHSGGFWMKNTLLPLSIAYFDADGTVLAVMDMPPCTQDPCPSYDPQIAYSGALEVNRGFFDEIGLSPGWRVDLPQDLPAPS